MTEENYATVWVRHESVIQKAWWHAEGQNDQNDPHPFPVPMGPSPAMRAEKVKDVKEWSLPGSAAPERIRGSGLSQILSGTMKAQKLLMQPVFLSICRQWTDTRMPARNQLAAVLFWTDFGIKLSNVQIQPERKQIKIQSMLQDR